LKLCSARPGGERDADSSVHLFAGGGLRNRCRRSRPSRARRVQQHRKGVTSLEPEGELESQSSRSQMGACLAFRAPGDDKGATWRVRTSRLRAARWGPAAVASYECSTSRG